MVDERVLKEVQNVEYEALQFFASFCKENGITFFLRGGSVLGAIKYNGFIPWDDDIDVAIPREDYERFIGLINNQVFDGKFIINSYKNNPELHCYFPRMVLCEEVRKKRNLPSNTKLGLHLMDIFPLDGAPDNFFARKIYFGKVYFLRILASLGTVYGKDMKNMHTKKQQMIIDILRFFKVDRLFNQHDIYQKLDRLYKTNKLDESKYAGTITASLFAREIFRKEIWGKGKVVDFNGLSVCVPYDYDSYLKQLYGLNYMTEEPDDNHKKSHLK